MKERFEVRRLWRGFGSEFRLQAAVVARKAFRLKAVLRTLRLKAVLRTLRLKAVLRTLRLKAEPRTVNHL